MYQWVFWYSDGVGKNIVLSPMAPKTVMNKLTNVFVDEKRRNTFLSFWVHFTSSRKLKSPQSFHVLFLSEWFYYIFFVIVHSAHLFPLPWRLDSLLHSPNFIQLVHVSDSVHTLLGCGVLILLELLFMSFHLHTWLNRDAYSVAFDLLQFRASFSWTLVQIGTGSLSKWNSFKLRSRIRLYTCCGRCRVLCKSLCASFFFDSLHV